MPESRFSGGSVALTCAGVRPATTGRRRFGPAFTDIIKFNYHVPLSQEP